MTALFNIFGEVLPEFTFVDIGAMALGKEPYAPLISQGIGRVIGFEPVSEQCAKLNLLHRDSGHQFLPYAIGDGTAGMFNIGKYPMTSSLFLPNTALVSKFQNLEQVMEVERSERIVTKRLDDIDDVRGTDYLKMDVQGAELAILQGARELLQETMIVHTEVEFVPLYAGQPLFADVDAELRAQGFLFHRFHKIEDWPFAPFRSSKERVKPFNQQLWADAVFVKDFTRFDELPPRKLLKLAIMLHELYHSYDLSALAIKSFDQQTGFNLHSRYCQHFTAERAV